MENLAEKLNSFHNSLLGIAYTLYYENDWPKEMEPEDLVSETYAQALAKLEQFSGSSPGELRGWLVAILKSRVQQQLQRYTAKRRGGGRVRSIDDLMSQSQSCIACFIDKGVSSPSSSLHRQEEFDLVYRNIARLSKAPREILMLRYVRKLEIPQIATGLHITEEKVVDRLYKATRKLADLMRKDQTE